MTKIVSIEQFVEKSNKIHNNKYTYSKTQYTNIYSKIIITCPVHGDFIQAAREHLKGRGCRRCSQIKNSERNKSTLEEFINKANKVHNNQYLYTKTKYINSKTKAIITCKIHGDFLQTPKTHLNGSGCPACKAIDIGNRYRMPIEKFIHTANEIHNNKYDYSKVLYKNNNTPVIIICPIHGEFLQRPANHLGRQGCIKCGYIKNGQNSSLGKEVFIEKSNIKHGNKYIYNKVEYINNTLKVKIICKKHGLFLQKAGDHLHGAGCPKCRESSGELAIRKILTKYKINYMYQFRIKECKNKQPLPFDFAILNNNTIYLIEYQGIQHYKTGLVKYLHDEEALINLQYKDKIKKDYCEKNNIPLLIIPYTQKKNIENILVDFLKEHEII